MMSFFNFFVRFSNAVFSISLFSVGRGKRKI